MRRSTLLVLAAGMLLTPSLLLAGFIPRQTQGGYPACVSLADLNTALSSRSSDLVKSGRCIVLRGGDTVFVEEQNLTGGWSRIRPKDSNSLLYVPNEAIR